MRRRSRLSLWIEETSTSRWAAAQRNFFQSQKTERDRTSAISCSSSAAMGSILFEREPSWKRFPRGAGRSSSEFLALENSRSRTKYKRKASSRAFPIWYGEQSNYFNTTWAG